jgi:hypothetical protein
LDELIAEARGDSLVALTSGFASNRARYLRRSAIVVDATADLDAVAAQVLHAADRLTRGA